MEVGGEERQARIRPSYLQSESGHLVSDQGDPKQKNIFLEVQVTGEAQGSSPEASHTSLEFEIATLAADGSGFSGDNVLWLYSQVV